MSVKSRQRVLCVSILVIFAVSVTPFALGAAPGGTYASNAISNALGSLGNLPILGKPVPQTPVQENTGTCGTGPGTCGNLGYGGGPLMHNSTYNLIFWLPGGSNPVNGQPYTFDNSTMDPPPFYAPPSLPVPSNTNYENLLMRFFQDVSVPTSSLWNVTTQYYDGQDNNIPPGSCFTVKSGSKSVCDVNTFVDTSPFPMNGGSVEGTPANPLQDSDIRNTVNNVISSQGWQQESGNNFFAVFLPYKVFECNTFSIIITIYSGCTLGIGTTTQNGFCGYHAYFPTTLNVGQQPTVYGVFADDGTPNATGMYSCMPGLRGLPGPNGDPFADATINTASHELFEAATDPQPGRIGTGNLVSNGWMYGSLPDGTSHEIGDECNFNFGQNNSANAVVPLEPDGSNVLLNGNPYLVQTEWSNSNGGCTLDTNGLPVNVTLSLTPDSSSNPAPTPFTVQYAEEGSFPHYPTFIDATTQTFRSSGVDWAYLWVRPNGKVDVGSLGGTKEAWAMVRSLAGLSVVIPSTSQTKIITSYYYDLLLQNVSYSISGGGSPPTPPNVSYVTAPPIAESTDSPFSTTIQLSTSPSVVWVLRGSLASVPVSVAGSTSGEQWSDTGASSWAPITTSNQISNPIAYSHQFMVRFSATPAPDGTVTPSSGFYNAGSTISINANPSSSLYQFIGWATKTGEVSLASTTSSSTTATINGPDNVTAFFAQKLEFFQNGLPAMTTWSISIPGVGIFANTTNSQGIGMIVAPTLAPGSYSWRVTTPIAGSKSGIQFVAPQSISSLSYPYQTEQMIVFTKQYLVLFSTNPSSAGSTSPNSNSFGVWYNAGSTIPISAVPYTYSGYSFSSWTPNTTSIHVSNTHAASTTAKLNGPGTITANFVQPSYSISFTEAGLPQGTTWSVTFNGVTLTNITNHITFKGVVYGTYYWSVAPTISGTPGVQYVTNQYNTMSVPLQTSAVVIYQTQYSVSFASNPSSDGYTLPSMSSSYYNAGSTVAITALPYSQSGYNFSSWSSSTSSILVSSPNNRATSMIVDGPGTLTANFDANTSNPCQTCTATFSEVGLPTGAAWSINFNGVLYSSSTNTISIQGVTSGSSYSWSAFGTIASTPGKEYVTSQTSGSMYATQQISQVIVYTLEYQVTFATSNPSFGTTTPSNVLWYPAGSMISILGSPSYPVGSYSFVKWTSSTPSIGVFNPHSESTNITINGPGTITANFAPKSYSVTFIELGLPSGTVWSLTFNGQVYFSSTSTLTLTGVNPSASNYWSATDQIAGASPGVRYTSSLQSGGQSGSISVPEQTSQVIVYTEQFDVQFGVSPTNAGYTLPSGGNWYNAGSVIAVTGITYNYQQYSFSAWSASSSLIHVSNSADSSTALTIRGAGTITANFASS